MVRMSGTAPGWTPVGSRGGGRWELLVFLLHLARFARALRGDWHRLGKRTDGFYFVDNRITPDSYIMMHNIDLPHVQVLVALACDLQLDSLPCCAESHRWAWFRRYCMAARVAKSLENRVTLPKAFSGDVTKKVTQISADWEELNMEHENHTTFLREQDEQILIWMNR